MAPNLLITGATGNLGSALIKVMSTQYRTKANLVAGVHPPNDPSLVRSTCSSVVSIDYDIASSMKSALDNVQYLFYVPSHSQHRANQFQKVIAVAKQCRVEYVVLISLLGCESRAGLFCSQFRDMEQLLEQSGLSYTILQCAPFQVSFDNVAKYDCTSR